MRLAVILVQFYMYSCTLIIHSAVMLCSYVRLGIYKGLLVSEKLCYSIC